MLVLTLSLARCSSWCLRPQMPVIMAGLDHRTVWRFTGAVLGQGFLHARCCATCVLVQTVFYIVAFPQLQFITVVVVLSRCVPFHCRQARVAKRLHCLDHCWKCSSWTSCSRPSLYNARCRLCPSSAQRCPWRHYRCSSWTRSWSLRQMPWSRQCAVAGSLQDRRLSYCGAEAVPRCPGETPQLFFHGGRCPCCADATGCSLPVVVPQVRLLDRSVRPVWWRLHRSGSWTS